MCKGNHEVTAPIQSKGELLDIGDVSSVSSKVTMKPDPELSLMVEKMYTA